MEEQEPMDFTKCIWRIGRKVGRTVYAQISDDPADDDVLIGMFDTTELAKAAVIAHNLAISGKEEF
jgi:hypothetical protein